MNTSAKATLVNFILSGIAWLLSLLYFLFMILGLWKLWHYVCFGFLLFAPIAFISQIIAIIISCKAEERWYTHKYILQNALSSVITVVLAALMAVVF